MTSDREILVPSPAPGLDVLVRRRALDGEWLFEEEQGDSQIVMRGVEQSREVASALLDLADEVEGQQS